MISTVANYDSVGFLKGFFKERNRAGLVLCFCSIQLISSVERKQEAVGDVV